MKTIIKNKLLIILLVVVLFVNIFICNIAFVFGDSMEPTLSNGDILLVCKIIKQVQNNDIVVTNRQNSLNASLIKRVIATQGQTVLIKNNQVYVDGEIIKQYSDIVFEGTMETVVPENEVFLLGDNFSVSKDSRIVGTIHENNIIGKVILGYK